MPGVVAAVEGGGEVEEMLTAPGVARLPGGDGMPGDGGREVELCSGWGGGGAVGGQEGQVEGEVFGSLLVGVPEGGEKDGVARGGLVAVEVGSQEGEAAQRDVEPPARRWHRWTAGTGQGDFPQCQFRRGGLPLLVQHGERRQGFAVEDGQHDVVGARRRAGQWLHLVAVQGVPAWLPRVGGRRGVVAPGTGVVLVAPQEPLRPHQADDGLVAAGRPFSNGPIQVQAQDSLGGYLRCTHVVSDQCQPVGVGLGQRMVHPG